MLTNKQREVLNIINKYIEREKISPTVRELCDIIGVKSTSTIHSHLSNLEEKGYITKIKDSPRSLRIIKLI